MTITTSATILEKILDAFENNKHRTGDKVEFHPEIKVKRDTLTLFISGLRKNSLNNLLAIVEVFDGGVKDKTLLPLGLLDDISLKAIYLRLGA